LRHQVIEIPPITPLVIEHRRHRLVCPCCSTSTCASLPMDVEPAATGPGSVPWWVCWVVPSR
jgi:hypothetical protein